MHSSCVVVFKKKLIPCLRHDLYLHTFPFIPNTRYFDNTCHDLQFTYITSIVIALYDIVGLVKCKCVLVWAVRTNAHMGRSQILKIDSWLLFRDFRMFQRSLCVLMNLPNSLISVIYHKLRWLLVSSMLRSKDLR
jgi:hypothetical protein